jgi:hypothetical protein
MFGYTIEEKLEILQERADRFRENGEIHKASKLEGVMRILEEGDERLKERGLIPRK